MTTTAALGMIASETIERDNQLLQQYASGDEQAFAQLVRRHLNLVYSAALRQVREPNPAEDVTQAVFIVLHQKAMKLASMPTLAGWLMTVTRYAAVDTMRKQVRMKKRERAVAKSEVMTDPAVAEWERVEPVLDAAMEKLDARDRDAIVLRFFEDKSFPQVGQTLGISEEAARKRVNRGIEKLRKLLTRQGTSLSVAALTTVITTHVAIAAPAHLAAAAISISTPTAAGLSIAKGAITMMAWAKAKLVGVIVAIALLTGGGGALVMTQLMAQEKAQPAQSTLPATQPTTAPATVNDLKAIQGTWEFVSAADNGRVAPAAEMRDIQIVITDKEFSFQQLGKSIRQTVFILNASGNPKWIDLDYLSNRPVPGIYELIGDTLRICYNEGGPQRPTAFASEAKPSPNDTLFVLKRVPDDRQAIQGTWEFVSGADEGVAATAAEMPEMVRFSITDKEITVRRGDKPVLRAAYSLDASHNPKRIDLVDLDPQARKLPILGIYELSADTLRLCHNEKTSEHPTAFTSEAPPSPNGRMVILKRVLDDRQAIQGTWRIISAEDDGKVMPADSLTKLTVVLTDKQMITMLDGKEISHNSYVLDPSHQPGWMDGTGNDNPNTPLLPGIYELSADTLRVCMSKTSGGERPSEFVSRAAGPSNILTVLKRVPTQPGFGPVIERTLNDSRTGKDAVFDFDADKIGAAPAEKDLAGWLGAMSASGSDVMAIIDGPGGLTPPQFTGLATASLQSNMIQPDAWDTMTADQVRKTAWTPDVGPVLSLISWQKDPRSRPATFVFRTSKGAMGLGQITEIQANPPQVRVRYKLVQDSKSDAPAKTQ
jgi:RNA polymerase sigma factor (sigma-70 family)